MQPWSTVEGVNGRRQGAHAGSSGREPASWFFPQLGPYEPQQLMQIGQLSELMQIEPSQLPSAAASCENSA